MDRRRGEGAQKKWRSRVVRCGFPMDEQEIEEAFRSAERTWPGLAVPFEVFRERLEAARREPDGAGHPSDLYLALACERGSPGAFRALENLTRDDLQAIVRRAGGGRMSYDDLWQAVRERLFVARIEGKTRIATFHGAGSLRGFVRVVATRIALNEATRGFREVSDELDEAMEASEAESPDVAYMRELYSSELRELIPLAFARLEASAQLMLRQHYVDGLTLDEMTTLHQVHRATIKRRLADARETVRVGLRELLQAKLGLPHGELERLLASVQSRFRITLQRFLAAA